MEIRNLIFIFISIIGLTKADFSSVVLWDVESDAKPSLTKLNVTEFANYLIPDIFSRTLVVFIGQDRCVSTEDFSKCKSSTGETCFKGLSQMENKAYYPNVEEPIFVLENTTFKKEYYTYDQNPEDIACEEGKILFVDVPNCDQDVNKEVNREELLAAVDSFIDEIYNGLPCSHQSKVGMYTVERSIRVPRQTPQPPPPSPEELGGNEKRQQHQLKQQNNKKPIHFNIENKFLIYYSHLSFKVDKENTETLNIESAKLLNVTNFGFNVSLTGNGHTVQFRVVTHNGYWNVDNLQIDDVYVKNDTLASISNGFSYYCGNSTFTNNQKKVTLNWENLQMEPLVNQTATDKIAKFNDPWHCVGFTSAGIWSGLFVTFMCLIILSIGISWLMDIRTMDRFDDPKGKTITITSSSSE